MADTGSKTRSLLKPIIAGVAVIVVLVLLVLLWNPISDAISGQARSGFSRFINWIGDNPLKALVVFVLFALFLAGNYVAHRVGRLRAWLFVVVVEIGLWILFWNQTVIPPLKDFFGLSEVKLDLATQAVSGIVVLVLSGVIFWILEAREAWKSRGGSGGD